MNEERCVEIYRGTGRDREKRNGKRMRKKGEKKDEEIARMAEMSWKKRMRGMKRERCWGFIIRSIHIE